MMAEDREDEGTDLLRGVMDVLPLLAFIGVAGGAWFSLQGQVIDLKARYELSTTSTQESLKDVKDELKENNKLLRELLSTQHNTNVSSKATQRPVEQR